MRSALVERPCAICGSASGCTSSRRAWRSSRPVEHRLDAVETLVDAANVHGAVPDLEVRRLDCALAAPLGSGAPFLSHWRPPLSAGPPYWGMQDQNGGRLPRLSSSELMESAA